MIKNSKVTNDNTLCLEGDDIIIGDKPRNRSQTIKECNCSHEQELKNERLKVEHLELRMKLILEENRILKSMVTD